MTLDAMLLSMLHGEAKLNGPFQSSFSSDRVRFNQEVIQKSDAAVFVRRNVFHFDEELAGDLPDRSRCQDEGMLPQIDPIAGFPLESRPSLGVSEQFFPEGFQRTDFFGLIVIDFEHDPETTLAQATKNVKSQSDRIAGTKGIAEIPGLRDRFSGGAANVGDEFAEDIHG